MREHCQNCKGWTYSLSAIKYCEQCLGTGWEDVRLTGMIRAEIAQLDQTKPVWWLYRPKWRWRQMRADLYEELEEAMMGHHDQG